MRPLPRSVRQGQRHRDRRDRMRQRLRASAPVRKACDGRRERKAIANRRLPVRRRAIRSRRRASGPLRLPLPRVPKAVVLRLRYLRHRAARRLQPGPRRREHWPRTADSGRTIVCVFCPDCGTRVWDEVPGDEETLCIKGGSLDQPVDLSAAVHIWTTRKLPGVIVPDGCRQVAQEPE
jgi:Glutathione-dependent formaldehyde-activating enzyme